MHRENLLTLFAEFERYASDPAVVQRRGYRRETWTYRKLMEMSIAWALELKDRGVRTGDRVLVWGPNSAEWLAAFWGCLLRGAVAVPMDDGATPEFTARVVRDAGVKLILCSRQRASLGTAVTSLVLEDLPDTLAHPHYHAQARSEGELLPPIYQTLADETITRSHIAQILFTSGTTAEPRGVVLTHGNFLANLEPLESGIEPYRKYEKWLHPLRFVTLVPLSHVFGQFMGLLVPPLLGATMVFELSVNPGEIIRTVKRERATALIAVPRMLDSLHSGIQRDLEGGGQAAWLKHAFESANGQKFLRRAWRFRKIHGWLGWRFWAFISGGAALSASTEEFFRRIGYAVVQGYGMTETASLISLNHPFRAAQGSIGKVLPGREFRLAEDGEILVRGENVSSGYWEKAKQGAALREKEEWLKTGDMGELDAEGNLRFRGRKKNVIVTPAGLNVYPEDLEAALRKQPGVRDAVVIPLAREGNAEVCAVLLLEGRSGSADRAAIDGANGLLAEYQKIRMWVVWPEADFPRSATGKPRLSLIAARAGQILAAQQANDPEKPADRNAATYSATFPSSLNDLLSKFTASNSPANHLEKELNLSSLDRVELLSALEDRFHVELSETAFAGAKTVGDVERLLRQPASGRQEYSYPRWAQRTLFRWLRLAVYYALVWPSTQILAHPKIVGREKLAGLRGPALVISNHITRRADIGLILAGLPRRYRHQLAIAMGGEALQEMRQPPRDWFFTKRWSYRLGYWLVTALFNVFPLPQFTGLRESFRFAGECVDRGYSVLVFPEGVVNTSEDGRMAPFQTGIGLLAENLGIPIVPMRLDGVWRMKRKGRRLARFGEITVHIGVPITFPAGTPSEEIARALEAMVRGL